MQEVQGVQGAATATAMLIGNLRVRDFAGQRFFQVGSVSRDTTVGEMLMELVTKLPFPKNDAAGRPLMYRARLEREGRHLDPNELVGDALVEEDEIALHPNVDAGGR